MNRMKTGWRNTPTIYKVLCQRLDPPEQPLLHTNELRPSSKCFSEGELNGRLDRTQGTGWPGPPAARCHPDSPSCSAVSLLLPVPTQHEQLSLNCLPKKVLQRSLLDKCITLQPPHLRPLS